MSRLIRFTLLVIALASSLGVLSSTASAVTWDNSGSVAFTATSGGTTLGSTGATVTCSSTNVTGSVPTSFVGLTLTSSGTAQFLGCTLSGIATTVHCTYSMTGTTWTSGTTAGNVDATCFTSQFGVVICVTEGPIAGSYANPTGGVGRATLTSSSTLRSTNPTSGTCALGNGDPLTLTANTPFTTTSASPPNITRTA